MWRVMAGVAFLRRRRRRRKRRRSASAPYIKHPPPLLLPPTDTTTSRRYMHVYTVSLSGQGSLALNQQRPGASEAGKIFAPASAHVAYSFFTSALFNRNFLQTFYKSNPLIREQSYFALKKKSVLVIFLTVGHWFNSFWEIKRHCYCCHDDLANLPGNGINK